MLYKKRALIIGSGGQDGILLSELLTKFEYDVIGVMRNELDMLNSQKILEYLGDIKPTEIYYLAAFHHSSESLPSNSQELFHNSMNIHFHGPVNFLDAITQLDLPIKFFFASSSHIFGSSENEAHTENTLYAPQSEYSITKLAGMRACQYYRASNNIFASTGILYNHESPLRKTSFLSKKIAIAVAEISVKGSGEIEIADLDAKVDWGDARDTVKAMHQILQLNKADDYIVATGELHSVRDFLLTAFDYVGLNYLDYVVTKKNNQLRMPVKRLGNSSKLKNETGWKPLIDFKTMVGNLVQYEINKIKENGI